MPGPLRAEAPRWALLVGNNYGGPERKPLKFAEDDARRLGRVLGELGRFPQAQIRIETGSSARDVLQAVARTSALVRKREGKKGKSIFLFYYSGHADVENLRVGDDVIGFSELKALLATSGADVVLLVLDACNSGAAIHTKGGRSAPTVSLFDETARARGRIILTSSSASEFAQESDELGSSFFTHYLISGLHGDADASGDRRITLAELYRYAYDRTVLRTVDTLSGVQHPGFSFDLEGEGSIVLSDLNDESTGVVLPEESRGTYLVFADDHQSVVAEIHKNAGEIRLVPVSPGEYTIKKRLSGHLMVAEVEVVKGRQTVVDDARMEKQEYDYPAAKGWDLPIRSRPSRWEAQALAGWTAYSVAPTGGVWSYPSVGVGLRLRGWPAQGWNARAAVQGGGWEHAVPLADWRLGFTLVQIGGDFSIGRALEYGPYLAEIGGRASVLFLQRRFREGGLSDTDQTLGGGLGPYGLVSIQLGPVRIALEVSAGLLLFPDAERVAVPYVAGGLGFGFGLQR